MGDQSPGLFLLDFYLEAVNSRNPSDHQMELDTDGRPQASNLIQGPVFTFNLACCMQIPMSESHSSLLDPLPQAVDCHDYSATQYRMFMATTLVTQHLPDLGAPAAAPDPPVPPPAAAGSSSLQVGLQVQATMAAPPPAPIVPALLAPAAAPEGLKRDRHVAMASGDADSASRSPKRRGPKPPAS